MLYNTKNPHGGDVYAKNIELDFSANINPLGTPRSVIEAASRALYSLGHYPDPYCRALVASIAAHEGVREEFVLCGNGAAELIYSFCGAERPAVAVELSPTFLEYSIALNKNGGRMLRFSLTEENGFAPTDELLRKLVEIKPSVLFICNPNNPTGRLMPNELMGRLIALCGEIGCRIFVDECFLELSTDAESLASQVASNKGLIILKAFTKNYALAGLRLGYCLCSDTSLLKRMAETVQPWNVSSVSQAAGIAALGEADYIEKSRGYIAVQRELLSDGLKRLGLKVFPSSANFLLFKGDPELQTELEGRGIAIRDCSNYYGLSKGYYRTAVRLKAENERLLTAIREIIS